VFSKKKQKKNKNDLPARGVRAEWLREIL
jgi:hypothetical protein